MLHSHTFNIEPRILVRGRRYIGGHKGIAHQHTGQDPVTRDILYVWPTPGPRCVTYDARYQAHEVVYWA